VEFLRRVLQHVLPKGFRRSRNFGFLHPNSKRLIALLKLLVFRRAAPAAPNTSTAQPTPRAQWKCVCCGGTMVVRRRIAPEQVSRGQSGLQWLAAMTTVRRFVTVRRSPTPSKLQPLIFAPCCQRCGSNSSIRLLGQVGSFSITSLR
jgi:hypothetical protein